MNVTSKANRISEDILEMMNQAESFSRSDLQGIVEAWAIGIAKEIYRTTERNEWSDMEVYNSACADTINHILEMAPRLPPETSDWLNQQLENRIKSREEARLALFA